MNRKHIAILFLSGLLFATTGCKKYLQIQPEGSYTDAQVFSSEKAAQSMLNGLYISFVDNNLYGAALTQTTLELMAQRFKTTNSGTGATYYPFQQYQYTVAGVQTQFDNTWTTAYSTILTANMFLEEIDQTVQNHLITQANCNLMKGEAMAVRAMLHFDMLRMFAPVYSVGADQPAIPYYTKPDGQAQPIISSTQIVDSILRDLAVADTLLANDAIKTTGVNTTSTDFYTGTRNQRLNDYAVKALMARVYLWAGRKTEAHDTALALLNEVEQKFPWLPYSNIIGTNYPDRIFSSEVLFAAYNRNLYTNYLTWFSDNLLDESILTADPTNLSNTFEGNENDYRYTTTWITDLKSYRTFYKYEDVQLNASRYLQPLIRKSELYYILAETETDPDKALGYLNTVRNNRGLPSLDAAATLSTEIKKEYMKEFYGEGQLFFYYKRNNTATIPNGVTNAAITPTYIVPLPLSETTPR